MGLWDPLGGTGPDAPLSRDGEEYLVPQPGVVIGNPAPLYIQGGLQQTMQIWCAGQCWTGGGLFA